jgi:Spy/CpxP family protein refolding chaperone
MNSNRKLLTGTLLAAGMLLTAAASISPATAADDPTTTAPPGGPRAWHHHGPGNFYSKLNLSAEQQASIKTIMENAGPQMKNIHSEMRANSMKLSQTQPNDPNYANVVAQVTEANGSLHSQMITQREAVRAQIFKILTPEQQTQLAALKAQMMNRPHGGARGWNAPPPPAEQ